MTERLDPRLLFALIASHIPQELHRNMLIVGSLAAAYHHRDQLQARAINTKDAAVVVQPAGALTECRAMAQRLLQDGWRRHPVKCFAQQTPQPVDTLRAIRLLPPTSDAYYVELLGLPDPDQQNSILWVPISLDDGWYGLPCFRYFAVNAQNAVRSEEGPFYAFPGMMALANLLAHREIGGETMSEPIGGRVLLRAAKDIGRVLALAWLAGSDGVEQWLEPWRSALRRCYPRDHKELAGRVGDGLRALLKDDEALEHAWHANDTGLLNGLRLTVDNLRIVGEQVLAFVVEPLFRRHSSTDSSREYPRAPDMTGIRAQAITLVRPGNMHTDGPRPLLVQRSQRQCLRQHLLFVVDRPERRHQRPLQLRRHVDQHECFRTCFHQIAYFP